MSQLQENLWTDERKDGRTDGETLFYRTLPAEDEDTATANWLFNDM